VGNINKSFTRQGDTYGGSDLLDTTPKLSIMEGLKQGMQQGEYKRQTNAEVLVKMNKGECFR